MKELLFNLALVLILSVMLSGCGQNADQQVAPPTPAAQSGDTAKKSSIYPPIATAIAQSDIKNLDGSTFKIADKKGKVLLLNMWATWCGPCRAEMPALVKMQEAMREQGLEIIGLNSDDESAEDIKNFAEAMNLNYTLVWPDTKLRDDLLKISQFGGIPQSFLIDRDGNLRGVFRGSNPADVRKMQDLVAKVVAGDDGSVPETGQTGSASDGAAAAADTSVPMDKPERSDSDAKTKSQ